MADEKPTVKIASLSDLKRQALFYGDQAMRWLFGLGEGWQGRRDILKNNYELGVVRLKEGRINDAIFRFKIVTMLNPKHAEAWYGLGGAYFAEGNRKTAQHMLKKALAVKPDYPEAAKLLSVASAPVVK